MDGKLVIISAPSGAGKTSIANYLLGSGLDLEFSISATTRKPRGTEVDGKEYYFISTADFKSRIMNNAFAEWEEVYKDQFYGTLKSELERIWSNKHHALFDVDVKGGMSLKRIFGKNAVSIFIMPPSVKELEERLIKRGTDGPEKIRIRVDKALAEMKLAHHFDHIVINESLERSQDEVYEIVNNFVNS